MAPFRKLEFFIKSAPAICSAKLAEDTEAGMFMSQKPPPPHTHPQTKSSSLRINLFSFHLILSILSEFIKLQINFFEHPSNGFNCEIRSLTPVPVPQKKNQNEVFKTLGSSWIIVLLNILRVSCDGFLIGLLLSPAASDNGRCCLWLIKLT